MDKLTRARRSWNMSRIRGTNTKPELLLRSALHESGLRFRVHVKELPGTPDIVLPRHRTVIFVHGCFWHRHPDCGLSYLPQSNRAFWQKKFDATVARDLSVMRQLRRANWRTVVVWECAIDRNLPGQVRRVLKALGSANSPQRG